MAVGTFYAVLREPGRCVVSGIRLMAKGGDKMRDFTALVESAKGFVGENYALSGLLFVVIALALAGKRKAALVVAVSAGILCAIYSLLNAHI